MAFRSLKFVMGQSLLALTVYYGKKMDDRKNLASSASPHEIALVYPVLKEYSPVTEEHNGSAGSHGEDKIVTYQTGPLIKVRRNRAWQSQLTSRQITAAIKLNLQTLRGHRAKQNIKWQGGRNVYQPNKIKLERMWKTSEHVYQGFQ